MSPPPPPATGIENLLEELGCACRSDLGAWECARLPNFADIEWLHAEQEQFAERVLALRDEVGGEIDILVQGLADSRTIPDNLAKRWAEAPAGCRRGRGPSDFVTNEDLAYLRSCTTAQAIESMSVGASRVGLLEPVDFTNPENWPDPEVAPKGANYKAAVVYLIPPITEECQ